MLIRCMIGNEVQNDLELMVMGRIYETIEVGQISEQGINVGVIRDVIPKVCHWRSKNRGEPYGVYAQLHQVWQTTYYSLKIPYPIVIAVLKGAGVDLIDDPGLPPRRAISAIAISCSYDSVGTLSP